MKNFTNKSTSVSFQSSISGLAGILGKILAQVILAPVCVVRTRHQQKEIKIDGSTKYKGYLDIATKIWRKEGTNGFYKGLFAGIVRSLPSNGTFYVFFHLFRKILIEDESRNNP
jgi:hypothetical protein